MNKTKWKNEKGQEIKFIKVIDLLNKIANGEEFPKRIEVKSYSYKWDYKDKCYICQDYEEGVDSIDIKWLEGALSLDNINDLNCEVEIIEEEPEIDIQGIEEINTISNSIYGIGMMRDKTNELIRAVKQLDNQINNK